MDKQVVLEKLKYDPNASTHEKIALAKKRECLNMLVDDGDYYVASVVGIYGTDEHRLKLLDRWNDRDVILNCLDNIEDPDKFMHFIKSDSNNCEVKYHMSGFPEFGKYLIFDESDTIRYRSFANLPFLQKLGVCLAHPHIAYKAIMT